MFQLLDILKISNKFQIPQHDPGFNPHKLFFLFPVFLSISLSDAHKQHPYGQSITIQMNEDSDQNTNLSYDKFKRIFAHPEVENRKVVILSIIGAYRKGKSFFLDYCLRFLYANVRNLNIKSTKSLNCLFYFLTVPIYCHIESNFRQK